MGASALDAASGLHKVADAGMNGCVILGSAVQGSMVVGPDGNNGCPSATALAPQEVDIQLLVNGHNAKRSNEPKREHPAEALAWLANHLNTIGTSTEAAFYGGSGTIGLRSGDLVVSGVAVEIPARVFACPERQGDCVVHADFGAAYGHVRIGIDRTDCKL
eukprot:SAG31_NODE_5017_length_2799_cov_2.853333_2_plen_161_part_00